MSDTRSKISALESELVALQERGDIQKVQRIKNKISAYESRLGKRARMEQHREILQAREIQLQSIMAIVQREVKPETFARVTACVAREMSKLSNSANLL